MTAVVGRPADLRTSPVAVALALMLPVGPAAVAALRVLLPAFTADTPAEQVADVAASPGREMAVLWLGLLAVLTLVPGVLLAGRLTRPAAPRLTAAALALLVPAYLCLGLLLAGDVLLDAAVRSGIPPADAASVVDSAHPAVAAAVVVFVAGHVVGTVLLGLALLRSRTVPAWAGWLLAVSQPLHFVAAVVLGLPVLDLVAWSMTAVAMAVVAGALLRTGSLRT